MGRQRQEDPRMCWFPAETAECALGQSQNPKRHPDSSSIKTQGLSVGLHRNMFHAHVGRERGERAEERERENKNTR